MANDFWGDKLGRRQAPPPQQQQQTPQQAHQAWWQQGQPQSQHYQTPTEPPATNQLAVQNYHQPSAAQQQRWTNGYERRPPDWVQRQPTDTCPGCGGVNYAQMGNSGEGSYGQLAHGQVFKRCFDCGYSNRGYRGALSGTPNSPGPATATRQTAEGGANLHNFHPKEVIGRALG